MRILINLRQLFLSEAISLDLAQERPLVGLLLRPILPLLRHRGSARDLSWQRPSTEIRVVAVAILRPRTDWQKCSRARGGWVVIDVEEIANVEPQLFENWSQSVRVFLDVEQRLPVLFSVLLTVLSLQLPDFLSISIQELHSHILDSLIGPCHECCFDFFVFVELFEKVVELAVELDSEVQLLVKFGEVINCDLDA